jgi:lipoyl(octanoyl) transferase
MPERITTKKRSAVFIDLGLMDYGRVLTLQQSVVRSKIENPEVKDHLYAVEHPAVYTLGKRGGLENLVVSRQFLIEKGIDIVETDRGGNITWHGPGQVVCYPIVDLEKARIAVKDFVWGLEEIMKKTAADFGVTADRDERNHGLWVNNAKIGSVGISIKKGISYHGLAMNISPDLTPFSWINPCGLSGVAMTSLEKQMPDGSALPHMQQVKASFITHFERIFSYTTEQKKELNA